MIKKTFQIVVCEHEVVYPVKKKKNLKKAPIIWQKTRTQSLGFSFAERIWTSSSFWADWAVAMLLSLVDIT